MDWDLVWIKAVHFTTCLSGVAWGRFQVLYLNSKGHSPTNNGLLRAGGLLAKFLCTPMWGAQADRHPPAQQLALSVAITGLLIELYRRPSIYTSFWGLLALKVVRSGSNGMGTLVDILTLRTIEGKSNVGYGSQRLWSGIAWGGGSFAVGYFIDQWGYDSIFSWTYFFSGLVLLLLLYQPTSAAARGGGPHGEGGKRKRSAGSLLYTYAKQMKRPEIGRFLVIMTCYGCAISLVESIMFLQLERDFDMPKSSMGTITLVGTLIEFPIFQFSRSLVSRFGHLRLLTVAHWTLAARLFFMSLLTKETAHLTILVQASHGVCFALAWTAAVDYAFVFSPPELKATSQSVVSTAYYILGAGFGSVCFSASYDYFGARASYLGGMALVVASATLILPFLPAVPHRQDRQHDLLPLQQRDKTTAGSSDIEDEEGGGRLGGGGLGLSGDEGASMSGGGEREALLSGEAQ
uniref:Major facilitator superfamily associated domain-containing protein n=1 Tax=Rhizochromulina marina TaxID=1034831 RepID=A0A7S2WHD1_9STRA|mmetsp:Transcript_23715/g.69424  ORF Transcript_23715/g.69424 Transcript_23715/m.69424 type:complete len:462 (+) Transcript_23715:102-1487(+)|eukprot:CAMPEP_0118966902 /NCGR_PEP_ID=MMETSP1173-20130426/4362_1 /TAXON_ID=1034831 /ORGANISM="Rhizochromulina marina cf, Strain CCMP1243" /LENGTH=461 /DNA_ID=CAMNT_0006915779 /DNA_START=35 /DNA_END=1420 /DNA_ORIENTATION=-